MPDPAMQDIGTSISRTLNQPGSPSALSMSDYTNIGRDISSMLWTQEDEPKPKPKTVPRSALAETASALGSGLAQTAEGIAGAGEMIGIPGAGKARKYFNELQDTESLARPDYLKEGTFLDKPERLADWRWWIRSLGENLPNMASMMIPGLGAVKVAQAMNWGTKAIRAAGLVGAWTGSMTLEAGSAYSQAKEEMTQTGKYDAPTIEKIATMEGLAAGTANSIIELLPFDNLFLRQAGADRLVKRIVRQSLLEGGTETAQEAVNVLVEKMGHKPDQNLSDNIGRLLEAGIIGGTMGGAAGGTIGTRVHSQNVKMYNKLAEDLQIKDDISGWKAEGLPEKEIVENVSRRLKDIAERETSTTDLPSLAADIDSEELVSHVLYGSGDRKQSPGIISRQAVTARAKILRALGMKEKTTASATPIDDATPMTIGPVEQKTLATEPQRQEILDEEKQAENKAKGVALFGAMVNEDLTEQQQLEAARQEENARREAESKRLAEEEAARTATAVADAQGQQATLKSTLAGDDVRKQDIVDEVLGLSERQMMTAVRKELGLTVNPAGPDTYAVDTPSGPQPVNLFQIREQLAAKRIAQFDQQEQQRLADAEAVRKREMDNQIRKEKEHEARILKDARETLRMGRTLSEAQRQLLEAKRDQLTPDEIAKLEKPATPIPPSVQILTGNKSKTPEQEKPASDIISEKENPDSAPPSSDEETSHQILISTMISQLDNAGSAAVKVDEDSGTYTRLPAGIDWLTDVNKGGNAVSKADVRAILTKVQKNEPLTSKQREMYDAVLSAAEKRGVGEHIAEGAYWEGKGFTPVPDHTLNVDDLVEGDRFVIGGEEFSVTDIDEKGNVTLKDGTIKKVKEGTVLHAVDFIKQDESASDFDPEAMLRADRELAGRFEREAKENGVIFNGMQELGNGREHKPLFTHPDLETTFSLEDGETVADAIKRKYAEKEAQEAKSATPAATQQTTEEDASAPEIVQPGANVKAETVKPSPPESPKPIPQSVQTLTGKKEPPKPSMIIAPEKNTDEAEEEETETGKEQAAASPKVGEVLSEDEPTGEARGFSKIADYVAEKLNKKTSFTRNELFAAADEAFGGTLAEGKYSAKDAYDAMEMGVNRFLQGQLVISLTTDNIKDARDTVLALKKVTALLPTQTTRTEEMLEFQQFSTPPPLGYVANWVANPQENDVYMEPSAGTGSLAVFAELAGVQDIIVNELSPRRAQILEQLGFPRVFHENAEQLHNILPATIKPTVVVMNPPFSSTAGRIRGQRKTANATLHIEQCLKRLENGGRLVAIVGEGMAADRHAFRTWWSGISGKYTVRANIGISGDEYKKYGTTFDNQIVVIDKTGPTVLDPITGQVAKIEDLIDLLKGVRDERTHPREQEQAQPGKPGRPDRTETIPGIDRPVLPATRPVGTGQKSNVGGQPPAGKPVQHAGMETEGGDDVSGTIGRPGAVVGDRNADRPGRSGLDDDTRQSDFPDSRLPADVAAALSVEQRLALEKSPDVLTDAVYDEYNPAKLRIPGSKPHPGKLVESAAMASVEPIDPTYQPHLPKSAIETGKISIAQLESVVYAGQAHETLLPSGERKGFFIGDGTGVGKGREIAAILWDNWNQGRRKALWITQNSPLLQDAKRDVQGIGWDPGIMHNLGKTKLQEDIRLKDGVLFVGYGTLKYEKPVEGKKISRVEQLVRWLGTDFDGVIAFDESHNMGNALPIRGARGTSKASQTALAGIELQRLLPKARIVYVSATGATEVMNLAYASRLGLWGDQTPFPNVRNFVGEISAAGIATMELVAREMKAMGVYLARSLSYDDVKYDRLEHALEDHQVEIYDEMARAWSMVMDNIQTALVATGIKDEEGHSLNPQAFSESMSRFWGTNQRFWNQIITSMQMPSVLTSIESDLKNGHSAVIQLVNTNEAAQDRAIAKLEEGEEMEDLDLTPREDLMQYVEHYFPVQQFEEYTDDNDNIKSRPVVDSAGNPVINPGMVKKRDELLDRLGSIRVPDGPLEMLLNHFGTEAVAEITGRGRRIIYKNTPEGRKRVSEAWSRTKGMADADAFMADKKQILVFSNAGGTGRSYHADLTAKNQRLRRHYLVQAGWRADRAVQGLGRSHRTNQKQAPEWILVTTNLKGQKRFISSIARRLDQLGALTRGQRETGSQGLFTARDNLESQQAKDALRTLILDVYNDRVPGITMADFIDQTGFNHLLSAETGQLNTDNLPDITRFLNRILNMTIPVQDKMFDAFSQRLDVHIARAIEEGTLDQGMETIRAKRTEKISEQTVYTDPETKAQTKYVEVDLVHDARRLDYTGSKKFSENGYARNLQSGRIWALGQVKTVTKTSTGEVIPSYIAVGANYSYHSIPQADIRNPEKYERVKGQDAQTAWNEDYAKMPVEVKERVHLITGNILPIWDRLPSGNSRIYRILVDGRKTLGRVIEPMDLAGTLQNLGASQTAVVYKPAEMFRHILDNNYSYRLSNGWRIRRAKVAGDYRIEIKGPNYSHLSELQKYGVFTERISYDTRFFIPTDSESGSRAIREIIQSRPVVEENLASGTKAGDLSVTDVSFMHETGQLSIEKHAVAPKPLPRLGAVPLRDMVRDLALLVKGIKIEERDGEPWIVTKSGHAVRITEVAAIDPNHVALTIDYHYGQANHVGGKIAGMYKSTTNTGENPRTIHLVRDVAGIWTLSHEFYHFLEDIGAISNADKALLNNKIAALIKKDPDTYGFLQGRSKTEQRAEWIGRMLVGIYDAKTPTGRIIRKIRNIIDRILNALGIRTAAGVVRDIETGRIFTHLQSGTGNVVDLNALSLDNQGSPGSANEKYVELHNFISDSIANPQMKEILEVRPVHAKEASRIKELTGKDVRKARHEISADDLRHMLSTHGNKNIESARGQIAITIEDINKIPYIIDNYDRIEKGSTGQKDRNSIRYIKRDNGTITYVEVVFRGGNVLRGKTMWKTPSGGVNAASTTPLDHTSETATGPGVESKISPPYENVKSEENKNRTEQYALAEDIYEPVAAKAEAKIDRAVASLIGKGNARRVADYNAFKEHWREFWSPFSTVKDGDKVLAARYESMGNVAKAVRFIQAVQTQLDAYPDDVKRDMFWYLNGDIPVDGLPEEAREMAKTIKRRTEIIGEMLVDRGIISQKTFEDHQGKYIHYMYAKHILGEDAPVGITSSGKLDLTYTIQRNPNLTMQQRKELGLIEDASVAVPVGMGKALTDIAKFDYLATIANNPDWVWQPSVVKVPIGKPLATPVRGRTRRYVTMGVGKLVDQVRIYDEIMRKRPTPEVEEIHKILVDALAKAETVTGHAPADFVQLPNSKGYGPLAGAYVTKPIADDLRPVMDVNTDRGKLLNTIVEVERQGMALFKMGKVALNVPTAVRNMVSNIIQNNMRGRPLSAIPGDIMAACESMKAKDAYYEEAFGMGLFHSSWFVTEINDVLEEFRKAKSGRIDKVLIALKNLAKHYGKIDDINKHAIFVQLRKEGTPIDKAALEAMKWGMDYSLTSRSIKGLRQTIMPFSTYQYKIAPLIAESLRKRPWVLAKFALIYPAAKMLAMALHGLDDDDWEDLVKQLPAYIKKSGSMMVLPWKTDKGQWQWVNLEYFFPWGNFLAIFRDAREADTGELLRDAGISNPFLSMFFSGLSTRDDQPPLHAYFGTPIYNALDPAPVKAAKYLEYMANTWMPSMLTRQGALGYTGKMVMGDEDRWGREVSFAQALGRWFGLNIVSVSPEQTRAQVSVRIQDLRKEMARIEADPSRSEEEKAAYRERLNRKLGEIATEAPAAILPITKAKGHDPAYEALKTMAGKGILHTAPPTRSMIVQGVPMKMTMEQYTEYLDKSSEITRRKLTALVESPAWDQMPDKRKGDVVEAIVANARKGVRQKIKAEMLRDNRDKIVTEKEKQRAQTS